MSTLAQKFYTPEQYLELERKAAYRSEYHDGQIFPMSAVSDRHDRITVNLIGLLLPHLKGSRCRLRTAGVRVFVPASGLFTYPDLSITCGDSQFTDDYVDTLTNPTVLIEVLSRSTESYDRGTKAKLYRAIPSLQELLIVAQASFDVELYRRQSDGTWMLVEVTGLDADLQLESIGCCLHLRGVYEGVSPDQPALNSPPSYAE